MLKTNKDELIKMAVMGEVVQPVLGRGYDVDFDGKPRISLGMSGIKHNITLGDLCYGWEEGEHVEPGLSMSNKNPKENYALTVLGCIGNEVKVVSGDAKGAKGYIIGKHGNFMCWFPPEAQEKISPEDKIQMKAWGVGLKIAGFEDTVRLNKIDPELLEKLGIESKEGKLHVPVTREFPCWIMGSGYGMLPIATDYDIQSTCDLVWDEMDLKDIRFGDVVCLRDQLNWWGRGYYEGAVTIGVIIHGWSYSAGHGPGVTTILCSKDDTIVPKIDPNANIAYYLGVKEKTKR